MINKIAHKLNCGINMKNTELLVDDFLWLWYQVIRCMECNKEFVVFRTSNNVYIELLDNEMELFLESFRLDVDNYNIWADDMKNSNMNITSNIQDKINYPISTDDIMVYSIHDNTYWTEKKIDMPFEEASQFFRPN